MARSWHERGQYANMIKDVLALQIQAYKKERDNSKKTKIAQSIGYLGQTVNSLISAQEEMGLKPEVSEDYVKISEDMIKEFVLSALKQNNVELKSLSKSDVQREITKFQKCDLNHTNAFFAKMEDLGLNLCKYMASYDLEKFAIMRHYTKEDS